MFVALKRVPIAPPGPETLVHVCAETPPVKVPEPPVGFPSRNTELPEQVCALRLVCVIVPAVAPYFIAATTWLTVIVIVAKFVQPLLSVEVSVKTYVPIFPAP